MSRPVCVHCGEPFGRRHTLPQSVEFPAGDPVPPYRGNGIVVSETEPGVVYDREPGKPPPGSTHRFAMPIMIDSGVRKIYRTVWDGESYVGGCDPFCTNRCAIDYARKAWKKHGQLRKHPDSL